VKPTLPKQRGLTVPEILEAVNSAIRHASINQSGVHMNTMQSLIKQTLEGTIHQEPSRGLQYFSTSGYKGPQASP
jgi:hypothetical protein